MSYVVGGYFLLTETDCPDWLQIGISKIISVSACICENRYPSLDIIWQQYDKFRGRIASVSDANGSKNNVDAEKIKNHLKFSNLTDSAYREMQIWIANKFAEKKIGLNSMFMTLPAAQEFYRTFVSHISDLKLIGISLHQKYVTAFVEESCNYSDPEYGMRNNLLKGTLLSLANTIELGYEILGYEMSGFHSYICNSLHEEYQKKFPTFKLNQWGLIAPEGLAETLASFTNAEIEDAEPVFWLPWKLTEYPPQG